MPKKIGALAKLSRPRLRAVYPRERLFALLDERKRSPVLWIAGPPGAGKTTLAVSYLDARDLPSLWYQLDSGDGDPASFFYYLRQAACGLGVRKRAPLPLLTPEYLADLPAFARRWFRALFGRLSDDIVMVLDNYQEVVAESVLHRMLAAAADEIPEGANLIVLSRSGPTAEFSRLLASDRLATVEWGELRLTLEEAHGIAAARDPPNDDQLRELHAMCDGWAAGFALMRERLRRTGEVNRLGEALPRETVFDYFATQIFNDSSDETRETLVRTAFLPWFTVSMAAQLSGNPSAGQVLAQLHERHLFIDCRAGAEPTYEYHALFRTFLLAQARAYYTPLGMTQLRQRAAGLMEAESLVDAAVELYLEAQAHESAVRLILQHAESMIAAGRAQTLHEWIGRLPPETVERFPWLVYWSGVCSLPTDLARARSVFERVCAMFRERGDILGEIKAAVGIIDSYYLARASYVPLDPWINLIFDRIEQHPVYTTPADELAAVSSTMIATLYRQPLHSRLSLLAERTRALLKARSRGEQEGRGGGVAAELLRLGGRHGSRRGAGGADAPAALEPGANAAVAFIMGASLLHTSSHRGRFRCGARQRNACGDHRAGERVRGRRDDGAHVRDASPPERSRHLPGRSGTLARGRATPPGVPARPQVQGLDRACKRRYRYRGAVR